MNNFYLTQGEQDLTLDGNGQIRFTQTPTEFLSSKIEYTLKTFQGEWFLNREKGVPYYDEVYVKNPDLNAINSLIIAVVNDIPEVDEVLELDVDYDRASSQYSAQIQVRGLSEIVDVEVNL